MNSIWYQPEEVYPVDGTPESREHAFWVPVDSSYFAISKKLEASKATKSLNLLVIPYVVIFFAFLLLAIT